MATVGGVDVNTPVVIPPAVQPEPPPEPPPPEPAPAPPRAGAVEQAQQPTPQGSNNPVAEAEIGGTINIAI